MLPVANQTLSNLSAAGRFNHNIVGWYASKIWLFIEIENWRFRLNPSYAWSLRTLHPLKCWILWRTRWTSSTNCFVYTALNIVGEMARIWDSMEMLKIILIIRGREWWIAIDFMQSRHHRIKPGSVWLLWSRLWRLSAFSRCKQGQIGIERSARWSLIPIHGPRGSGIGLQGPRGSRGRPKGSQGIKG